MTQNTASAELGARGGGGTTPNRQAVLNTELDFAREDIARLKHQLTQTREVRTTVSLRLERFQEAVAQLSEDLKEIVAKEETQIRMLRSRKTSLIDLEMEIE